MRNTDSGVEWLRVLLAAMVLFPVLGQPGWAQTGPTDEAVETNGVSTESLEDPDSPSEPPALEPLEPGSAPTDDDPETGDVSDGAATPLPVDRVVDPLEYLDPDPNPLLLQNSARGS
ncbi:MAG: hypothetical protein HC812_12725 [Leptolyngbya sp. RL_3_1]|nr:hypothetical protein [Leptolyngbya sp. RL_3_1]